MGCYTATAGHHSNVIRTSRAVLCPLHAQLAATSHRLAFCSTCVRPMQCPLRAPAPAHTGSPFCPPALACKEGTCTICPPPPPLVVRRLPCSFFPRATIVGSHHHLFLLNGRSRSTAHPRTSSLAPQPHRPSTRAAVQRVHHHRSALFGEPKRLELPPSFLCCSTPLMTSSSRRICPGLDGLLDLHPHLLHEIFDEELMLGSIALSSFWQRVWCS
jgi:hypothetical protein